MSPSMAERRDAQAVANMMSSTTGGVLGILPPIRSLVVQKSWALTLSWFRSNACAAFR